MRKKFVELCGWLVLAVVSANSLSAQTAHGISKSPQTQEAVATACEKGDPNKILNVPCSEMVDWLNSHRPGLNIKDNVAMAAYIRSMSVIPCPAGNPTLNREVDGKILHETAGRGWKRGFRTAEQCLYDNNRGEIQFSLSCWNSPYEILSVASAMPTTRPLITQLREKVGAPTLIGHPQPAGVQQITIVKVELPEGLLTKSDLLEELDERDRRNQARENSEKDSDPPGPSHWKRNTLIGALAVATAGGILCGTHTLICKEKAVAAVAAYVPPKVTSDSAKKCFDGYPAREVPCVVTGGANGPRVGDMIPTGAILADAPLPIIVPFLKDNIGIKPNVDLIGSQAKGHSSGRSIGFSAKVPLSAILGKR